ncbi:MAG TPA: YdcF family protein [Terracidiphilus sp.]
MPRSAQSNVPRNYPRRSHRKSPRRRTPRWKLRLILGGLSAVLLLLAWAEIARSLAPASNTSLTRFDAIIVLGYPADSDGNPKPTQLARVIEAVHEYQRGVAPRLILTGGAAHNRFIEAQVMARSAEAEGIPDSAVFPEPEARDTIENACYAARIMKAHGWRSAEVVSSDYQLPRAGLIFHALAKDAPPLEWSSHAAPPLSPQSSAYQSALSGVEVLKTARYLIWARWFDRCEP